MEPRLRRRTLLDVRTGIALLLATLLPAPAAAAEALCSERPSAASDWPPIRFQPGLTEVVEQSPRLACIARLLRGNPSSCAWVEGFADSRYDDYRREECLGCRFTLATARAEAVRQRLIGEGADEAQIRVVGHEPSLRGEALVEIGVYAGNGDPIDESVCGLEELRRDCRLRYEELSGQQYAIDFIVATLPDPIDSQFGRLFDLYLGSIQRAMASHGYRTDRFCLPWPLPGSDGRAPGVGTDPEYRRSPGVVIFRKGDAATADRQAKVVLLVGETPKAGVHRRALRGALDLAHRRTEKEQPLWFLAPSFSGSTHSLASTIKRWGDRAPDRNLSFVSGTATVQKNEEVLRCVIVGDCGQEAGSPASATAEDDNTTQSPLAAGAPPADAEEPPARGDEAGPATRRSVEYLSVAATNQDLEARLWDDFVAERWLIGRPIPDGEETGPATGGDEAADSCGPGGAAGPPIGLLVESSAYGEDFGRDRCLRVFRFPMNIWALRTEHAKNETSSAAGAAEIGELDAKTPTLTLGLGGSRRTRDVVPQFEAAVTARSQELVLTNLLDTIVRERIRIIGIVATNVMDQLFLAEYLQHYAPNVRLVTFEADLLLAHPSHNRATYGTLVASSNPLFERSGRFYRRFASDGSQGVYEAVHHILKQQTPQDPRERPEEEREVWIGVVANSEIVPLARYGPEDAPFASGTRDDDASGRGVSPQTPRGWATLFWFVSALLAGALVYWGRETDWLAAVPPVTRNDGERRLGPQSTMLGKLLRPAASRLEGRAAKRLWFLIFLFLTLTAGYLLVSLPYLRAPGPRLADVVYWMTGGGVHAITTHCVLLLLTFSAVFLLANKLEGDVRGRLVVAAVAAVMILLGLGLAIRSSDTQLGHLELLLLRSGRLSSGVNPLLPAGLLLLIPFIWLLLALWRDRELDAIPGEEDLEEALAGAPDEVAQDVRRCLGQAEGAPAGAVQASRSIDLRDQLRRLRRQIDPASFGLGLPELLLLVVIPVVYLLVSDGRLLAGVPSVLQSVEPWAYDIVISVLLVLGVVLTIGSGFLSWRGWAALRRILGWAIDLEFARDGDARAAGGETSADATPRSEEQSPPQTPDGGKAEAKPEPGWIETLRVQFQRVLGARTESMLTRMRKRAFEELLSEAARQPSELARALARLEGQDATVAMRKAWLLIAGYYASERRDEALREKARDFFAWQTGLLTREVFRQLLYQMAFMTVGLILLLTSISFYPFQPQTVLVIYLGSLMVIGIAASVVVVLQMENDTILGILMGTEKQVWTRGFVGRLALYAGLPLLSLLASRFPAARGLLLDWIKPLFKFLG